jgi:dTDP-4-dehydrorhamnose reductase
LAIQQVLQRPELSGLYHLAASGEVSWHGYASHVIGFAQDNGEQLRAAINPIETIAYPTPARRPLNSD